MRSRDFLTALRASFRAQVAEGERVLLAVSGGVDSSALMVASTLIREDLGIHFEVATIDHGLRLESASEAHAVLDRAQALGLTAHVRRVNVPTSGNLEAGARSVRYQALEDLRSQRALTWIATAHTASDQAETVLMRLGRGSALRGARGIAARKGRIIRPLLELVREECVGFVHSHGIPYFSDPMNLEPRFLRTRVRHELLPRFQEVLGAAATRHLASFAAHAAEDEAFLAGLAQAALTRLTLENGSLDAAGARALHPALQGRVFVAWLETEGLQPERADLNAVREALLHLKDQPLDSGALVRATGGTLRLERAPPPGPPKSQRLEGEGSVLWAPWYLVRSDGSPALEAGERRFTLLHEGPVWVRARRPGDRVQGADGRHRKVQDVLVDARIPREARASWPLLCDAADRVMWVIGVWPQTSGPGLGVACVRALRKGVLLSATSERSL